MVKIPLLTYNVMPGFAREDCHVALDKVHFVAGSVRALPRNCEGELISRQIGLISTHDPKIALD
jgi:hypothetical protein